MKILPLVLAVGLAAAAVAPVQAQQRAAGSASQSGPRDLPVSRAFAMLDRYYGLPAAQRTRFRPVYTLRLNDRPYSGQAWFVSPDGRRTPVPVNAGRVGRLPTPAQVRDERERFLVDAPAGSRFAMTMSVAPDVPLSEQMDATALAASVTQVNAALRSAAGMMRFMVPTFTRVVFQGGAGATAVMQDGSTQPLPVVGGSAVFTPTAMPRAQAIRFSSAPTAAQLAPAARR